MVAPSPPLEPFLTYARFRFHLRVKTLMVLPPYKGAVFRGAFGNRLKRLVCVAPRTDCRDCLVHARCLYLTLFEPQPPSGYADAGKFRQAPRPYVLNPPLTPRQVFHPGEILDFELVLIGPAIDALPYFIHIFQELGQKGLGPERGRYALLQVEVWQNGGAVPLYAHDTFFAHRFAVESGPPVMPGDDAVTAVTLELLTPMRLKVRGDLATSLTFLLFWEHLSRRLDLLAAFYGQAGGGVAWSVLGSRAATIATQTDRLQWYDWERYSRRQQESMKLGGLQGTITFRGNLGPFLPYLRLGEHLHVGQGTTFGLGGYRLATDFFAD